MYKIQCNRSYSKSMTEAGIILARSLQSYTFLVARRCENEVTGGVLPKV